MDPRRGQGSEPSQGNWLRATFANALGAKGDALERSVDLFDLFFSVIV
jgi:hypothetical protein